MAGGTLIGVEVASGDDPRRGALSPDVLALLAQLERDSRDRRSALLRRRLERQAAFAAGIRPGFLANTRRLRDAVWSVATPRQRLAPVIVWPTTIGTRLRDLSQFEPRVVVDGRPVGAALHDLVVELSARLAANVAPPHRIRLPGLEGHLEARLWSETLRTVQEQLALPPASLQAIVAVETLPALFELDEMLWELQPFAVALELDRTELTRSTIEKLGDDPAQLSPDLDALLALHPAAQATLDWVAAVAERRGLACLLAAQQPVPSLIAPNSSDALAILCDELSAAARARYDAVTIGDPALLELAERRFVAERGNARRAPDRERGDRSSPRLAETLCAPAPGARTRRALEETLGALLEFETASPRRGLLAWNGRSETAATAALRSAQLLQWLRHAAPLEDGPEVTPALVRALLDVELGAQMAATPPRVSRVALPVAAARLAERLGLPI